MIEVGRAVFIAILTVVTKLILSFELKAGIAAEDWREGPPVYVPISAVLALSVNH